MADYIHLVQETDQNWLRNSIRVVRHVYRDEQVQADQPVSVEIALKGLEEQIPDIFRVTSENLRLEAWGSCHDSLLQFLFAISIARTKIIRARQLTE